MLSEKTIPVDRITTLNEATELVRLINRFKSSETFELAITSLLEQFHAHTGIAFSDMWFTCECGKVEHLDDLFMDIHVVRKS